MQPFVRPAATRRLSRFDIVPRYSRRSITGSSWVRLMRQFACDFPSGFREKGPKSAATRRDRGFETAGTSLAAYVSRQFSREPRKEVCQFWADLKIWSKNINMNILGLKTVFSIRSWVPVYTAVILSSPAQKSIKPGKFLTTKGHPTNSNRRVWH